MSAGLSADPTLATYGSAAGAAAYMAKELPLHEARSADVYRLLDGLELKGTDVLDVGCGFGRDVGYFRSQGARAIGVDASSPLLAEARLRYGAEGFFQADVLTLEEPPQGRAFDLIWCCALLVHVPRVAMPELLNRWAGWLKPDGRLVLLTKEGEGARLYENLGAGLPRMMVFYTPAELRSAVPFLAVEVEEITTPAATQDRMLGLRLRKE